LKLSGVFTLFEKGNMGIERNCIKKIENQRRIHQKCFYL